MGGGRAHRLQSWFSQVFSLTLPGEEVATPVAPGCFPFSSPLSLSPGQTGAVTYQPSPHHTHSMSLE